MAKHTAPVLGLSRLNVNQEACKGSQELYRKLTCDVYMGPQYARVYANGKMVTRTDVPGQTPIFTLVLPVVAGTKYLIVLNGDMGDPYGGYRGHPGVRCMPLLQPLVKQEGLCPAHASLQLPLLSGFRLHVQLGSMSAKAGQLDLL